MPQIILRERAAPLASYTFFTRNIDHCQNTLISQRHQPPRSPFSPKSYR